MTDITATAPITLRRPRQLRFKVPKLGIGAAFAAMFEYISHTFALAYVVPYQWDPPPAAIDADLDGRDPSW